MFVRFMERKFEKPLRQTVFLIVGGIAALLPMIDGLHSLPALISGIALPLYFYGIREMFVSDEYTTNKKENVIFMTGLLIFAMGFGYHWFANIVNDFPEVIHENSSIVNADTYWHDEIFSHTVMVLGAGISIFQILYEAYKKPVQLSPSLSDYILLLPLGIAGGAGLAKAAIGFGEPIEPQHWIFCVASIVGTFILVVIAIKHKSILYILMTAVVCSFMVSYQILFIPYLFSG